MSFRSTLQDRDTFFVVYQYKCPDGESEKVEKEDIPSSIPDALAASRNDPNR